MEAWTDTLDQQNWWRCRADIDGVGGADPLRIDRDLPGPPHGLPHDINDLAEEAISGLHGTQRSASLPTPEEHEGADDGRHVIVRVGPGGLSACEINPGWAERQHGPALSAALGVAVKRATASTRAAPSPPNDNIGQLVGDALATLTSLTTHPTTRIGDE